MRPTLPSSFLLIRPYRADRNLRLFLGEGRRFLERALDRFKALGFVLIIVTNQPDVARGTHSRGLVDAINQHILRRRLSKMPSRVFTTTGTTVAVANPCTASSFKERIATTLIFPRAPSSATAGANVAVGVQTVLIDYSYADQGPGLEPDAIVANVSEAADWIVAQVTPEGVPLTCCSRRPRWASRRDKS